METLFPRFYEGQFSQVGEGVQANPEAARAVATLKGKGYRAVTTMPMFPLAAVHERIRWAGLDPDNFEFATDYETCYAETHAPLLRRLPGARRRCGGHVRSWVGNHNREDGLATKVGCDIYFVTDHLIESEEGLDVSECKHGSMAEFADWCEALPSEITEGKRSATESNGALRML